MKKPMISGLAVAVLALSSFTVSADSQYPAADFEPHVIYLDKSVAAQTSSSTNNSQPACVCPASTTMAKAPAQPVVDEFDPKYPAANFQPKVIYP